MWVAALVMLACLVAPATTVRPAVSSPRRARALLSPSPSPPPDDSRVEPGGVAGADAAMGKWQLVRMLADEVAGMHWRNRREAEDIALQTEAHRKVIAELEGQAEAGSRVEKIVMQAKESLEKQAEYSLLHPIFFSIFLSLVLWPSYGRRGGLTFRSRCHRVLGERMDEGEAAYKALIDGLARMQVHTSAPRCRKRICARCPPSVAALQSCALSKC